MGVMDVAKAALRSRVRGLRKAMPPAQRAMESAAACAVLAPLILPRHPSAVASYAALPDELDVGAFHRDCWQAGVAVLLPRVEGGGLLTWHRLSSAADWERLRPGAFGIREPDPAVLPPEPLPAGIPLVVPGVAFAADGRRLGQGGGFYDRVLGHGHWSVGVGFTCQLVDHIPCDGHDRRVEALVIAGRLVLGAPPAP